MDRRAPHKHRKIVLLGHLEGTTHLHALHFKFLRKNDRAPLSTVCIYQTPATAIQVYINHFTNYLCHIRTGYLLFFQALHGVRESIWIG